MKLSESPTKGHKNDERIETSYKERLSEGAGTVQHREERIQRFRMIYSTVGSTSVQVYYSLFYQAEFNALGSQRETVVYLDDTFTDFG